MPSISFFLYQLGSASRFFQASLISHFSPYKMSTNARTALQTLHHFHIIAYKDHEAHPSFAQSVPYQWDLNYKNPRVFNEMMYNFLYHGSADNLRKHSPLEDDLQYQAASLTD